MGHTPQNSTLWLDKLNALLNRHYGLHPEDYDQELALQAYERDNWSPEQYAEYVGRKFDLIDLRGLFKE